MDTGQCLFPPGAARVSFRKPSGHAIIPASGFQEFVKPITLSTVFPVRQLEIGEDGSGLSRSEKFHFDEAM